MFMRFERVSTTWTVLKNGKQAIATITASGKIEPTKKLLPDERSAIKDFVSLFLEGAQT